MYKTANRQQRSSCARRDAGNECWQIFSKFRELATVCYTYPIHLRMYVHEKPEVCFFPHVCMVGGNPIITQYGLSDLVLVVGVRVWFCSR